MAVGMLHDEPVHAPDVVNVGNALVERQDKSLLSNVKKPDDIAVIDMGEAKAKKEVQNNIRRNAARRAGDGEPE